MDKEQSALNQFLYPRGAPLEPVLFRGFAYSMSSAPIKAGDLILFCPEGQEIVFDIMDRLYGVGRCKRLLDNDQLIVYIGDDTLVVPAERCKRLTFTIPTGLSPANFLAN